MGALATNVIPLEVLQEEEAKNQQPPPTQIEALTKTKASGVDVSMANNIMGLLFRSTLADHMIRLPHEVKVPLMGSSIVLPLGMQVGEDGRIHRNGVPLPDEELGGVTLTGGLCERQLEAALDGEHQSVSPVVRYLKLSGHVTSIRGHVWRDPDKKRSASLKLYITGKPFIPEDYREASTKCDMLVGSTPELREWLSPEGSKERPQNVAAELLFSLMEHGIKDIDGLVAERHGKGEDHAKLLAELEALKNELAEKSEKVTELGHEFEKIEPHIERIEAELAANQRGLSFRDVLIKEMAGMSTKLNDSTDAKMRGLAGKTKDHFKSIEDDAVLLGVYKRLIKEIMLTAMPL
jgi:hypothetical protein